MSTLAVVEGILREAAVPMSVREIVERAAETLPTKSKTPDTVVARDLSMDIKRKGQSSIFIRTAPGRYTMRDLHASRVADEPVARPTDIVSSAIGERPAPKGTKSVATTGQPLERSDKTVTQPQQ